jgi:hypothetical protein
MQPTLIGAIRIVMDTSTMGPLLNGIVPHLFSCSRLGFRPVLPYFQFLQPQHP